jgi:hypothetical protein
MENNEIRNLEKEDLLELLDIYSKNWLAMDGVWFQSIEQKFGMNEAIERDINAWRQFTEIEALELKNFYVCQNSLVWKG